MEFLSGKKQVSTGASSTQKYVDVVEVRDGILVLKTGGFRAILLASSVNFDLKSSDEQDAIIAQYQNFLNSLDFPVQILVHSRRFRIEPYLEKLVEEEKKQENELLRFQISEYRNFVKNLTEVSNVMSKFFYVVVPFAPSENEKGGILGKLTGVFRPQQSMLMGGESFEMCKSQLIQRTEQVATALSAAGVRTTLLTTEEAIELLYNSYNPSLFTTTIVRNVNDIELGR